METEDVTGDHGLDEAIELRDALRLYGVLGTDECGELSSETRKGCGKGWALDGRLTLMVLVCASS